MATFQEWSAQVDAEIIAFTGRATNDLTAPYAEMFEQGLTVSDAAERALDKEDVECPRCGGIHWRGSQRSCRG